ncbi:MAG: hypothetical protein MJ116_05235 [Lachnospiraceae bacterium]|nr:hypothetical protein [Lachnospiraceae bacterium]
MAGIITIAVLTAMIVVVYKVMNETEEKESFFQMMHRRAEENHPVRWRFEHAYVD